MLQGGDGSGYRAHHAHHHALPPGDLRPRGQGPPLHHQLPLLEWRCANDNEDDIRDRICCRNIPDVHPRLSGPLETGHNSRLHLPPSSNHLLLPTARVTQLADFQVDMIHMIKSIDNKRRENEEKN